MSDLNRAELRQLLDEAETPWTIEHAAPNMGGPNWQIRREGKAGIIISAHEYGFHGRGELIAAAVNALPDLLNALDVAEGHRDSLAATLAEMQREQMALERAIERVRVLHYAADNDSARTPRCEQCQGRAGAHPCGCWAEVDREPVCGHCNAAGLGQRVPWPCPTIQALDGCGIAVLPDLLAQAWDEGHRASERDWEMAYDLLTPDEDRQPWTNPYRQEANHG